MQKRNIFCFIFFGIMLSVLLFSCKKNNTINEDPSVKLILSTESVLFDTVFTTVGSTTKMFYIKNPSSEKIVVSSIRMAEGTASPFSMNVDGVAGNSISDVEIAGNDSIFIFVKVTVDPQNSNSPMVIRDSILFDINSNQQHVNLTAWGQDAHYIVADKSLTSGLRYKIVAGENENITWTNDKPYLIYGYAVIDTKGHLDIEKGCRLHFFNNSGMWVYSGGSFSVNGTASEPVTFEGSRLEQAYKETPGQWDRILINEGTKDNVINYAIIKNGFIGIQTEKDSDPMSNRLILTNTIIRNMEGVGLLSRFYHIIAGNTVFANCGAYAVTLTSGGSYDFRHCTIGNYWNYSARQSPSLVVSNYYTDLTNNIQYSGDLDSAYFGNCIIYGLNDEELLHDSVSTQAFNYKFDHCLIKTKTNINKANFVHCLANHDPMFRDYSVNDYRLMAGSAAIDKGDSSIIYGSILNLQFDLLENNRMVNPPADLGAYDYRP